MRLPKLHTATSIERYYVSRQKSVRAHLTTKSKLKLRYRSMRTGYSIIVISRPWYFNFKLQDAISTKSRASKVYPCEDHPLCLRQTVVILGGVGRGASRDHEHGSNTKLVVFVTSSDVCTTSQRLE